MINRSFLSQFDSLIFDLDGTLWNTVSVCTRAWREVLNTLNIRHNITEQKITSVMGLQIEAIAERFFSHLDESERLPLIFKCLDMEKIFIKKYGATLYDKTRETLEQLSKEFPLFIVSNCQKGYIETFLDFYKLNHLFKDIECPGNTQLSKAENIQLIIKRNQLTTPVYIGDTKTDLLATQQADIPFIYAEYGFGNLETAQYSIQTISQLCH